MERDKRGRAPNDARADDRESVDEDENPTRQTKKARGPQNKYTPLQKSRAQEVLFSSECADPSKVHGVCVATAAAKLVEENGWSNTKATLKFLYDLIYSQKRTVVQRGRKVNREFEVAVRNELMVTRIDGTTVSAAFSVQWAVLHCACAGVGCAP